MARRCQPLRALVSYLRPQMSDHTPQRIAIARESPMSRTSSRSYISEMRKSAFKNNFLRLLRGEIQYELDRLSLGQQASEVNLFKIDDRTGEQWVRLTRKFGGKEKINVEATMFDGSLPIPKYEDTSKADVQLHITVIVCISKGGDDVLEILCSAWSNEIEISRLFVRKKDKSSVHVYPGPKFTELDVKLQESLYEFLDERGVDDEMAVFLHDYMKTKDRTELIGWLNAVKSCIEK